LTIITGNQSCDLDSAVSSHTYALLGGSKIDNDELVIPLLNINRVDLKIRKDVHKLFQDCGFNMNDIFCIDDFKNVFVGGGGLKFSINLILTDHNSPQGDFIKSLINDYDAKVVGIIDHHFDEGEFKDAKLRIIQECGSCTSLVIKELHDNNSKLFNDVDSDLRKFCVMPILMDTSYLKRRVCEVDLQSVKLLVGDFNIYSQYYNNINDAKNDLNGFTMIDILKKDYKCLDVDVGDGDLKIGVSSIPDSFSNIYKQHDINDIIQGLKDWKIENDLKFVVFMTSFNTNDGEFKRELGFLYDDDSLKGLIDSLKDELNLTLKLNENELILFNQLKIECSRKQVIPLIK
ncbi:hypothetical protein CANARDRAFT_184063, partial [[Candida] arabinofermentans NRRL YB-2248]